MIAADHTQITIPVEGMTCVTCEIALEKSLNNVTGVTNTDASTKKNNVSPLITIPVRFPSTPWLMGLTKPGIRQNYNKRSDADVCLLLTNTALDGRGNR